MSPPLPAAPPRCDLTCTATELRAAGQDDGGPLRGRRGRLGEQLAAEHLVTAHGLILIARNWRIACDELRGELDLVARDARDGAVVVCEVKTRSATRTRDGALASLSAAQQRRIRRLTGVLLATGALPASRIRFDLIAVDLVGHGDRSRGGTGGRTPASAATLTHLPHAF